VRPVACTLLTAGALLAAGCGGGTKSPSVANLGTTTSSGAGTTSGGSLAFSAPPGGFGGFGGSISITVPRAAGARYAACMRSHGVPNFPDPDSTGTITLTTSPSLDPAAPHFQSAERDCSHLIPVGKGLSPARQQQMKARLLAFAACMRSHGVPKYPDPTFSNGGVSQGYGPDMGIDPHSPIFQRAQRTCQEQTQQKGGSSSGG